MSKITPFLWFDDNLEQAMAFYGQVFKENFQETSKQTMPDGKVMVGTFKIFDQEFNAMNAGPQFKFNEAVSFLIDCDGQEEVDYYWNSLTADGGEESMCGWLKDKFGLSWQVIPKQMNELMSDPNPEVSQKAMQAMMQMKKIVIADLS